MASLIVESAERIQAKRKAMEDIFAAFPEYNMPAEKAAEIKSLNDELQDLGKKHDELVTMNTTRELNQKALTDYALPTDGQGGFKFTGNPGGEKPSTGLVAAKSLGERFVESAEYKAAAGRSEVRWADEGVSVKNLLIETKTVMVEGGPGYAPANPRTNIVVPSAQPRPVVADLIPQSDTQLQAIRYMVETTFTNNATAVAEGALKPESALAFTEQVSPVQVIATFLPITTQQLDDVPGIQDLVNQRLTLMVLLAEEVQLLTGNGSSPNLTGILNVSGLQTQAVGTDPGPDAVYKAITKIRWTGFADPSGIVMNPTNWQNIRLLRTTDGVYIWGSPADTGVERLWGLPVVQSVNMTLGTALLGDFRMYSHISRRMGLRLDVSNSHSDFFIRNQLAIRLEERLSLEVYRAAAFCKVTGLA